MIDVQAIHSGVVGLVGIRQPYTPAYAIFDSNSLQSDSGLYVDDIPFVKGEFFVDVVCPNGVSDPDKNEIFRNMLGSAATTVVSRIFSDVDFIDRQVMFSKANNLQNLQTDLTNGFVGYKLKLGTKKNVAFRINRLFLEVEGSGNLELMLFNTNNPTAIETETVAITSGTKTYEVPLNWTANNTGFYKGDWYIGYNFDGTITPYERDYEDADEKNRITGLEYDRVFFKNHSTTNLFDLDDEAYLGSQSNGINCDITVYEDYTNLVLTNKNLFARAIQMQFAVLMFQEFISSIRSNSNERYSNDMRRTILAALNGTRGDGVKEEGLKNTLTTELVNLKREVGKLTRAHNKGGQITVKTLS